MRKFGNSSVVRFDIQITGYMGCVTHRKVASPQYTISSQITRLQFTLMGRIVMAGTDFDPLSTRQGTGLVDH